MKHDMDTRGTMDTNDAISIPQSRRLVNFCFGQQWTKALLVGAYFMHLVFDWGRLYFVIIPVVIMATMLVVVLLPDIVLAWRR